MKYIKLFDTTSEFNTFKESDGFVVPHVSLCEDDLTVVNYLNVMPVKYLVCKYDITDTSSATTLYNSSYPLSLTSMKIDDVETTPTASYTFSTTGEHTVKYELADPTSIGVRAFRGCTELTSVTIPDSVTSIGLDAFNNCPGLTSISVAANNQIYDSRNNCNAIIETSTNKLIFGCKNTIIPNSVTSIGNGAFYQCTGLTSINIPNSVTSIGPNVFSSCLGLTSIIIGNSVTSIGNYAFASCSSLTSITCNATTAPTIQSGTFMSTKKNGTLTVPVGSTGYNVWMGLSDYYLGSRDWTKVEQ